VQDISLEVPTCPLPSPETHLEEVINQQILQDLRTMAGDDDDANCLLSELIQVYLEDTPVRIQSIKEASTIQDRSKLQKAAHALRSPSVSLGALNLGKICETLEDAAKDQSWDKLSALVNQLEGEYQNVITVLQNLII
jgi:HPt (histidine-containing phosphotransfer) domain-containing protein